MNGLFIKKIVGKNLRTVRKSMKLTTTQLSKELGISQSNLSRIENGQLFVTADVLYRLRENLKVDIVELFYIQRKD
jgi:transcriptional regulator with XRE-family HTH domain